MRRLKTDYIDLFQLHGFDAMTPQEEVLSTLDQMVREGKIRYIGCSNFSGWHLMKALSVSERLVRRLGDGSQSALGERLPVLEPTPRRGSGDQEPHESRRAPDRPPNDGRQVGEPRAKALHGTARTAVPGSQPSVPSVARTLIQ